MTHSFVKAICKLLREQQSELPVYDELGEPNADTARVRVWRDSVDEIVPDQYNFNVRGTVSIEHRSECSDASDVDTAMAQQAAAVERVMEELSALKMLDELGCSATLLDRIHVVHEPISYSNNFWCAVIRWRAYLQY